MIELLQERLTAVSQEKEQVLEEKAREAEDLQVRLDEVDTEVRLKKGELEENEAIMERVNEAMEEHTRDNQEVKAKCKFIIGQYRREVEQEGQEDSVSEYREGEEVDILGCFELMQDLIEQYKMQKEERIFMLEGIVNKTKAEKELVLKELDKNKVQM